LLKRSKKQIQVKEIKIQTGNGRRRLSSQTKSLTKFLNDGDKTKITVRYRGREMAHREIAWMF